MNITVVGSTNIDFVVTADKRPKQGETMFGSDFKTIPGGKGANQAVAAARLDGNVTFLSCIGDDLFGEIAIKNLKANNVNTDYIKKIEGISTGTAHIVLAENDNSILVIKGANDYITPEYIKAHAQAIENADVVLAQQEMPVDTVDYLSELCESLDIPFILNPAPAREISQEVIESATYLTPNEHEAQMILRQPNYQDYLSEYPNKLIVTEGASGVRYHDGNFEKVVQGYKVDVVDTTGAGDTFNGAFAVAIAEGKSLEDSLKFANKAASISVTGFGAQGGMPTRKELDES